MARKCCIIFCLVLWLVCPVRAGRPVLKSWQMTTAHGLPNNTVRCVFQDHRGRIWMGTQNGLACYDGNRVEVYALKDAGGEERIPGPKIRQIVEESGCGKMQAGLCRISGGSRTGAGFTASGRALR